MTSLKCKNSYEHTQQLGTDMREEGVSAFLYYSARSLNSKKNTAAFVASVFQKHKNQYINNQQHWKCVANKEQIEFTRIGFLGKQEFSFSKHSF